METFTKLLGSLLLFVYHCFDRVAINGYLSGLSRPGQVAHFFHNVAGEPPIGKEVLLRRTGEYRASVEAFARNHAPIAWAEPKARKEDCVRAAPPHGTGQAARRVFHSEKHGAGPDLPLHGSPLCHRRSQLSHSGAPEKPLHELLLLHS